MSSLKNSGDDIEKIRPFRLSIMDYKKLSRICDSAFIADSGVGGAIRGSVLSDDAIKRAKTLYENNKKLFDDWANSSGVVASDEGEGILKSGREFVAKHGVNPLALAEFCVWRNASSVEDIINIRDYYLG